MSIFVLQLWVILFYNKHLASIIREVKYKEILAKNEEKYVKDNYNRYIGICIHRGYLSCIPKKICEKIAWELGVEAVPDKEVSKELRMFSLAYVDSEGKTSNRWGTDKRMYHIRVRELVELFEPYEHKMRLAELLSYFGEDMEEWE